MLGVDARARRPRRRRSAESRAGANLPCHAATACTGRRLRLQGTCGAAAGDSDSDISRGMMAVMFESLQDLTPEQILEVRTGRLGLSRHTLTQRRVPYTRRAHYLYSNRMLPISHSARNLSLKRPSFATGAGIPSVMRTLRTP